MNNCVIDFDKVAEHAVAFNLKVGNKVDTPEWEDIVAQAKVWFEEAQELYEAILTLDQQEPEQDTQEQLELIVDGIGDTLFTYPVLIEMLNSFGFDVSRGYEQVVELNNFKMFTNLSKADLHLGLLQETGKHKHLEVKSNEVGEGVFYTIRNENNKIIKRVDHPLEDFSECLPQW